MGKQNVLYTYNRILFHLRKEGNSDTCYKMDEPGRYYARWNKPEKKDKYYIITFIWGTRLVNLQRQKVEWWLPGAGGKGE